jgi:hypothetical protein
MLTKFECLKCRRCFNRSEHLKNHLNKKIPCIQEDKNIILTEINKNLQNNPKINTKTINNNPNNFSCEHCNKIFTNIYTLKRHTDNYCKVKKEEEIIKKNNSRKS